MWVAFLSWKITSEPLSVWGAFPTDIDNIDYPRLCESSSWFVNNLLPTLLCPCGNLKKKMLTKIQIFIGLWVACSWFWICIFLMAIRRVKGLKVTKMKLEFFAYMYYFLINTRNWSFQESCHIKLPSVCLNQCYYIGGTKDAATGMLKEVVQPVSYHKPAEKICERLKSLDSQICELQYGKLRF